MSKDVIVVAHATERKYLLDEYEQQLKDARIDFHIEPIDPLPDGLASMTMRWRIDYWCRMSLKFREYDRIVFTDAWDVLYYGAKLELLAKIPPMIVSAERNCWPDDSLAAVSPHQGPWMFPNPGMMAGYPEAILHHVSHAMKQWACLDEMDQLWLNMNPLSMPPDTRTTVLYVVSRDKEDGSLDRTLTNQRYNTRPHFFHFAGPCHPEPFRAMLRGEVDSL